MALFGESVLNVTHKTLCSLELKATRIMFSHQFSIFTVSQTELLMCFLTLYGTLLSIHMDKRRHKTVIAPYLR